MSESDILALRIPWVLLRHLLQWNIFALVLYALLMIISHPSPLHLLLQLQPSQSNTSPSNLKTRLYSFSLPHPLPPNPPKAFPSNPSPPTPSPQPSPLPSPSPQQSSPHLEPYTPSTPSSNPLQPPPHPTHLPRFPMYKTPFHPRATSLALYTKTEQQISILISPFFLGMGMMLARRGGCGRCWVWYIWERRGEDRGLGWVVRGGGVESWKCSFFSGGRERRKGGYSQDVFDQKSGC